MRVVSERMLEVFDNDSIRRILHVRLRRRLCLTNMPAQAAQRTFRWFGHGARRHDGEPIKDLLLSTPLRTLRRQIGGQLKTWVTTIKADMEPPSRPRVFGNARWRKDWVKVSRELVPDRRAWSASMRDEACSVGGVGSTLPG